MLGKTYYLLVPEEMNFAWLLFHIWTSRSWIRILDFDGKPIKKNRRSRDVFAESSVSGYCRINHMMEQICGLDCKQLILKLEYDTAESPYFEPVRGSF
jgi:hypothetical protein